MENAAPLTAYRVELQVESPRAVFEWLKANVSRTEVVRAAAYEQPTGRRMVITFRLRRDAEACRDAWYPGAEIQVVDLWPGEYGAEYI